MSRSRRPQLRTRISPLYNVQRRACEGAERERLGLAELLDDGREIGCCELPGGEDCDCDWWAWDSELPEPAPLRVTLSETFLGGEMRLR